jgi:hypothetical protein
MIFYDIFLDVQAYFRKKSTSPPTMGVDYLTPSTMKWSILPLNFPKPVKSPPRRFSDSGLLQYRQYCYSNSGLAAVPRFVFLFISMVTVAIHGYCSNPPFQNRIGGNLTGFEKFKG